jgi:hypothetical protein
MFASTSSYHLLPIPSVSRHGSTVDLKDEDSYGRTSTHSAPPRAMDNIILEHNQERLDLLEKIELLHSEKARQAEEIAELNMRLQLLSSTKEASQPTSPLSRIHSPQSTRSAPTEQEPSIYSVLPHVFAPPTSPKSLFVVPPSPLSARWPT